MAGKRYPWVWDYDIDEQQFDEILAGRLTIGRLDRDWAAVRLIEYAGYREMIRRIGFPAFARDWPRWRPRVRGEKLQEALDFLATWISSRHPELVKTGSGERDGDRQSVLPDQALSPAG